MTYFKVSLTMSVIVISQLLLGCSEKAEYVVKKPMVEVYNIPIKAKDKVQNFPVIIAASDLTNLSFRISGELIDIPVNNGQKVKKGDLIAKLDPTTFSLSVKDKQAKAENAKKTMLRAKKLVELGSMAESTFDELDARFRVAQAEFEMAQLQLNYVELRAPFDGIIANVPADNFQTTSVGEVVATMHRTDMLEVKVDLPDAILAVANTKNKNTSKVELDVTLDAYPDHIFKASYKEHTTEQTIENKKYVLTLEMPIDPERIALQGMPGSVKVDIAKLGVRDSQVFSVPIEAVLLPDAYKSSDKDRIIWRVKENNKVEAVKVEAIGLASTSFINVVGPLKQGNDIVVKGMLYLHHDTDVVRYEQEGQ